MSESRQRVRSTDLAEARLKMKRSPGRWVRIPTKAKKATTVVQRQKRGDMPALPPGEFEAKSVQNVPYGRYVPEVKS